MDQLNLITIGTAHVNTTVGNFSGNTDKIKRMMIEMAAAKCSFAVFQECAISGYSPEELVLWPTFQEAQLPHLSELVKLSGHVGNTQTIYIVGGTFSFDGRAYNVAYVINDGKLWGIVPKMTLPEYGIFHDKRVFAAGVEGQVSAVDIPSIGQDIPFGDIMFSVQGKLFSVSICEDIWTPKRIMHHAQNGSEMEINISASPFQQGVVETRYEMLATRSADNQMIVVYTSQVGGQGGVKYDGDGYVFSAGRPLLRSPRWHEGWESVTVSLDSLGAQRANQTTWRTEMEQGSETVPVEVIDIGVNLCHQKSLPVMDHPFVPAETSTKSPKDQYFADLLESLIVGLGDFIEKSPVFKRVGINSSGGRDSALVAIIATLYAQRRFASLADVERKAAIADFVNTFSLPTRYNSTITKSIARSLAGELGINFKERSIEALFDQEISMLKSVHDDGWQPSRLTLQNKQAEIRAEFLSGWCGANQACFLNTSNMSEKAMGYGTKRGDMLGDYGVISNVMKTVENRFLLWLYEQYHWKFIPILLGTVISAELEDNQSDEADLMPYEVLDAQIKLANDYMLSPIGTYLVLRSTFNKYEPADLKSWVRKYYSRLFTNVHKWVTSPEGQHDGRIDFDRERSMHLPTIISLDWLASQFAELENSPD